MRRHLARLLVGICCMLAVFGHVAHWWRLPAIVSLDAYLYDIRLRLGMPGGQDEQQVQLQLGQRRLGQGSVRLVGRIENPTIDADAPHGRGGRVAG